MPIDEIDDDELTDAELLFGRVNRLERAVFGATAVAVDAAALRTRLQEKRAELETLKRHAYDTRLDGTHAARGPHHGAAGAPEQEAIDRVNLEIELLERALAGHTEGTDGHS